MAAPDLLHAASALKSGDLDSAKSVLRDLITQVPSHITAHVLMAQALEMGLDYEGALSHWKKAAYLCPENAVIESGLRKSFLRHLYAATADFEPVSIEGSTEELSPTEQAPTPEFQDLDKLIEELETARIVPDPEVDMIPQSDLDTEIEDVVSETLARIYAHQKYFLEAADVYAKLAEQHPEKMEMFKAKAEEMRLKTKSA